LAYEKREDDIAHSLTLLTLQENTQIVNLLALYSVDEPTKSIKIMPEPWMSFPNDVHKNIEKKLISLKMTGWQVADMLNDVVAQLGLKRWNSFQIFLLSLTLSTLDEPP